MFRNLISILLCLFIASCSFNPILYNKSALDVNLTKVTVVGENKRDIKNFIEKEFSQFANPEFEENTLNNNYNLQLRVNLTHKGFDTRSDSIKKRSMITARINIDLQDEAGETIYNDFVIGIENYEITQSPFSSLVAKEESTKILLRSLINEIVLKLNQELST